MKNNEIYQAIDSIFPMLPKGRTEEENNINKIALKLLANLLVNINTIAASLAALADKHGTAPEEENPNQQSFDLKQ